MNPTAPAAIMDYYALHAGFIDFIAAVAVVCIIGLLAIALIAELFKD